ncbi:MAG: hypothetical protein QOJ16_451 [Acidobacteriota bacterium]|jgi:hypothetical protein|nr:hypothetical protein [Acidobacteriota bacterium]
MQWSKLKARVESFFAPAVTGRVELRTTNYRHVHDGAGRGWITIDGREVYNFCTQKYWVEGNALSEGIRTANRATDWSDPAQEVAYYEAGAHTDEILEKRGIVCQGGFESALADYLTLTVNDALASDHLVHRALAVLDGRLGKRRLRTFELRTDENPLVKQLLDFRCQVEGLLNPMKE